MVFPPAEDGPPLIEHGSPSIYG